MQIFQYLTKYPTQGALKLLQIIPCFARYITLSHSAVGCLIFVTLIILPEVLPHFASYIPTKMKRLIIFLFCLVLVATATADDASQHQKLVECINAEMDKDNKEWKLKDDELKKLKDIVDKVAMKEPLKPHNDKEQKNILKEIEDAAKRELPNVKTETIDSMMMKLKEHAMHCKNEMGS